MKKAIVTGATGFIGRALCEELLNNGYFVYGIGRNTSILRKMENCHNFKGIFAQFSDYLNLPNVITERGFELFIHAANFGVNGQYKEDYNIQINNTLVSCQCVEIASQLICKRFVFIGSIDEFEVSNRPDQKYILPTHSKIYGTAKFASEQIGKVIADKNDIEYVSALLALTFGEGNRTNILPNVLIKNSFCNKPIDLIEGNNFFDLIHISEAVGGIIAIAEKGLNHESYYVGHSYLRSFKTIVCEINNSLPNSIQLNFGAYKDKGYSVDYKYVNLQKLYNDTGYQCLLNLKEGVEMTYKWLLNELKEKNKVGQI